MDNPGFPINPISTAKVVEQKYVKLMYDLPEDKYFHFSMLLENDWRIVDKKTVIPDESNNFSTIALFKKATKPQAEIEVLASLIPREVNPSDWLELWLFKKKAKIFNGRKLYSDYGTVADYIAKLAINDNTMIMRAISVKDHHYIFTIACRVQETGYADVAEDFFMAVSSFELAHPKREMFAEKMHAFKIETPIQANFLFPASWRIQPEHINNPGIFSVSCYNYKDSVAVGIFTFTCIAKTLEPDMEGLLNKYLENFAENQYIVNNEYEILPDEQREDTYRAVVKMIDAKGNKYEITSLFTESEATIQMFAICSFTDMKHYDVHIINKRAHEIAFDTFELSVED